MGDPLEVLEMGSEVVLELARGHGAHQRETSLSDETEYLLRLGDGAYASARFPWSRVSLEDLKAAQSGEPGAQARQRVGEGLRAFLDPLGWNRLEAELLQALSKSEVFVTIRCNAGELCRLPLELVTLQPSGLALGQKDGCHVQWEWPGTRSAPRALAAPPEGGTLLLAWSAAGGPLDAAGHLRAMQQAAKSHGHPGKVEQLGHASVGRLRQTLDSARGRGELVAVLHLLCHGGPLPGKEGGYGLWLEGPAADSELVDPVSFAAALEPYAGLVGCVVLCACHGANLEARANALDSVAQRLHRAGFQAVVASRAPLSSARAEAFSAAFYDALLAGEPLHRAVARGRRMLGAEWPALQVYARAGDGAQYPVVFRPYRGLQAFEERDQRFFFGRAKLTGALVKRVVEAAKGEGPRFQVVAGSSGSGKSSLVQAGLLPELRKSGWRLAALRPRGDSATLEKGLARLARALRDLRGAVAASELPGDEAGVVAEAQRLRAESGDAPLLLVVDQLEEAFKLDGDEPQRFLSCLWNLTRDDSLGLVVLSTFRADLLERADDIVLEEGVTLQGVMYQREHLLYVPRMGREELLDAIRRPLSAVGLSLEAGVAEQLREEVGKEPGALPLLEHGLDALWQRREGRTLTRAAYETMGGLTGALSGQLDSMWERLPQEQQRQGRRLLAALVDFAEDVSLSTRRRGWVEELRPEDPEAAAAFDAVLELLVARRLLVRGQAETGATPVSWVEIAHEALIRRWTRLQGWLRDCHADEVRLRELEAVARAWEERRNDKDGGESYLPFGDRRAAFEALERRAGPLPPGAARCLEAARSKHQRDLIAQAVQQLQEGGDPMLGLALLNRAQGIAETEELLGALARWANSPGRAVLRHSGQAHGAAFSPDGQRAITASEDGTACIWEAATGKPLAMLSGHAGCVWSAAFSPDGRRAITAGEDATARVWDAATGQRLATLSGHAGCIRSAAFSPDGRRAVTASDDTTACVWDATTGQRLATLSGHSRGVRSAAFHPGGRRIVTASDDKMACLWDAETGAPFATLFGHYGKVCHAAFSPDGQRVVTASWDGTARIWKAASGRLLTDLSGHSHALWSAAFSPDGQRIVTASEDKTARVWNAKTGEPLAALFGHQGRVWSAVFSSHGRSIVTASEDKTARVWDAATGKPLTTLSGHADRVWSAAFSPDGRSIVTASKDKTARIWKATSGKPLAQLSGHSDRVRSAAFSLDGQRVVTTSGDRTARVWDAMTGELLLTLSGHGDWVYRAGLNPDGRRVVTASKDKTARIWDLVTGKLLATLHGHFGAVYGAGFSPDGRHVVTASWDKTANVWDAAAGKLLAALSGHAGEVYRASFSPDGRRVVTASEDKTARVWDAASGQQLVTLLGHTSAVCDARFSPDGQRVVTASEDKTACLWDAVTGRPLATCSSHSGKLSSTAFSPDGRRVATASEDGTARLWDATTGALLTTLSGHLGPVAKAELSPEGRCVVTASEDGTARVWDATTGKLLTTLVGHFGAVDSAEFSPDGQRIVTAGWDGTAQVWEDFAWMPLARQREVLESSRELTPGERRTFLHAPDADVTATPRARE